MNWKRIVALAAAGLIVGAIPVFVIIDYRREPVWLPAPLAWSDLPVTVGWDSAAFGPWNTAIRDAISETNREVGCTVLSPSGKAGQITLLTGIERDVCPGVSLGPRDTAATYFCRDGSVDIHIQRLGGIAEAYLIVRHELAHGLGLAHDDKGLMAPQLVVTSPLDSLSRKDRKALKERYCR